jgi:hypothetical protein
MTKDAYFSDCRKYRYWLLRVWDESKPMVQLVGLNPSTANEDTNDPTIESIIRITMNLGYGGFYMTNLFAFISSNPEDLRTCTDPLNDNDRQLLIVRSRVEAVIFCWGAFPMAEYRAKIVKEKLCPAKCFGKNKGGSPKHPLYLKATSTLIDF